MPDFTLAELSSKPVASKQETRLCAACHQPFVRRFRGRGIYCYNEACIRARELAHSRKESARAHERYLKRHATQ